MAARTDGTLIDFETVHRSGADLIEDFKHLSGAGLTREQIAERLGYANAESLRVQLHNAQQRIGSVWL